MMTRLMGNLVCTINALAALLLHSSIGAQESWTRYHRLPGWGLDYNATAEPMHIVSSEYTCTQLCEQTVSCYGWYYNRTSQECVLRTWRRMAIQNGSEGLESLAFRDQVKLIFIRDLHTFTEAEAVCASISGRLMTRTELQSNIDEGYHKCSCGWLADGSNVMPMAVIHHTCSLQAGQTGVIDCPPDETSRIFCSVL